MRTTLNRARICHWGCESCARSIGRVREGVAGGRAGAWPIWIKVVVIVRRRKVTSPRGVDRVCVDCVGWVIDSIVDGTEDCAGVRLAVVDGAVWVGVGQGGISEVCRTSPERALSELSGLTRRVVGGGPATRVFLVEVVVVVVGSAIPLHHLDSA